MIDDEAPTTARSGKRVRPAPVMVSRSIIPVSASVARAFQRAGKKKYLLPVKSKSSQVVLNSAKPAVRPTALSEKTDKAVVIVT